MRFKGLRFGLAGLGAALLMAAAVTGAFAQNAYYREVVKDGRIYVFNSHAMYQQWEGSGEAGVGSITLLGHGPNGESMVFDSENALHLYNFKHDRPGEAFKPAAQAVKPPVMQVTWKDGKTTIQTDRALLNISNRIQLRFTEQLPDETVQLTGTENKGDALGSFRIRRAKLKLDGWFYKKTLQYEFQANWAELAGTAGNTVEDANLNWDVLGTGQFQIKFGQFKVPFGRQELTSSGSQQFVDRALVSNEFAKGRDMGLQIWGLGLKNRLDWRLGIFNGNGRLRTANDNDAYQLNGRLTYQPFGDAKYSESDFDSIDRPLLALAADFEINDLRNTTSDKSKNLKRTILGGDVVFKYKGFSATGEYFNRKFDAQGPAKPDGVTPPSYNSNGYYAQAGYLFARRTWELALRYGSWDPTDAVSDNDRTELGGALSYYYNKHNFKVQADFRRIEDKAKQTVDNELRVQTQFIF